MTAVTPGPPPRDHRDGQVTPGQAAPVSDWWVCDGILPPHGTGQKIIGPFATQELALNVRTYVEKAGQRTDLWVDDEPATPQPAPELADDAFRCPDCGSPQPSMHPAISGGGEVTRICVHPFHADAGPATPPLGTAWRLLNETRGVVAEILATFGRHQCDDPACESRTTVPTAQLAEWRTRAGLDQP